MPVNVDVNSSPLRPPRRPPRRLDDIVPLEGSNTCFYPNKLVTVTTPDLLCLKLPFFQNLKMHFNNFYRTYSFFL